jgi:dUTP pyrophosphatase
MKVQVQRVDKELPLPLYETKGAVGFDFLAREDRLIQPGEIVLVPGNVIVKIPDGYALFVASRSSTPRKKGLSLPHGIGVIDQDYNGPHDEIMIQVRNFTESEVVVKRGEKIAQGMFVRVDQCEWEEVESHEAETRGGFGSSGGYG